MEQVYDKNMITFSPSTKIFLSLLIKSKCSSRNSRDDREYIIAITPHTVEHFKAL